MLVAIIGLSWEFKNWCWSKVKLSMKQISYLIIINYDEIILIIAHLPSAALSGLQQEELSSLNKITMLMKFHA